MTNFLKTCYWKIANSSKKFDIALILIGLAGALIFGYYAFNSPAENADILSLDWLLFSISLAIAYVITAINIFEIINNRL